jgi:hypothetical protein
MDKTDKVLKTLKSRPQVQTSIATDLFLPNHSGDMSAATINTAPTATNDIPNKAYVDALTTNHPHQNVNTTATPQFLRLGLGVAASVNYPLYFYTSSSSIFYSNIENDVGGGISGYRVENDANNQTIVGETGSSLGVVSGFVSNLGFLYSNATAGIALITDGAYPIIFKPNSTEAGRFETDGDFWLTNKCGIGVTPSYPLHIYTATADRNIHTDSARASGNNYGIVSCTHGAASVNYGVYSIAENAGTNYSFYGAAGTLHNVGAASIGTYLNVGCGAYATAQGDLAHGQDGTYRMVYDQSVGNASYYSSENEVSISLRPQDYATLVVGRAARGCVAIDTNMVSAWAGAYGVTASTLYLNYYGGATKVNAGGYSTGDFVACGDTDANLLTADASADKVGIGIAAPAYKLDVNGDINIPAANCYCVGGTAGISAVIVTAPITLGGTQGSMTFTKGILTAQTPAT